VLGGESGNGLDPELGEFVNRRVPPGGTVSNASWVMAWPEREQGPHLFKITTLGS